MFEPEDRSLEQYIAQFKREMELRKAFSQALMLFAATERLRKDMAKVEEVKQAKRPLHERLVGGMFNLLRTLANMRHQTPPEGKEQRIDFDVDAFYTVSEDGTVQSPDDTEKRKENLV